MERINTNTDRRHFQHSEKLINCWSFKSFVYRAGYGASWTLFFVRIGFMASEEMSFEWKYWRTDGRTDDRRRTDGRQTTDDGCLPILQAHLKNRWAFGSGELINNRSTALESPILNYCGGGGLKPDYAGVTLVLCSVEVQEHRSYSVHVKNFYLINASWGLSQTFMDCLRTYPFCCWICLKFHKMSVLCLFSCYT